MQRHREEAREQQMRADVPSTIARSDDKAHLVEVTEELGVTGVSRMRKDELVDEIRKANARATRKARS